MSENELRVRILPVEEQVLVETHTNGIVKCKEIQAIIIISSHSGAHGCVPETLYPFIRKWIVGSQRPLRYCSNNGYRMQYIALCHGTIDFIGVKLISSGIFQQKFL